jgi:hypothetical protein
LVQRWETEVVMEAEVVVEAEAEPCKRYISSAAKCRKFE